MDQNPQSPLSVPGAARPTRRQVLKYGAMGLAGCSLAGGAAVYWRHLSESVAAAAVFKNDAPDGELWRRWQDRGWVKQARHYLKLDPNVQCKLCPNDCLLEPEDRGRCRNKINKDGTLYTLTYGNPCALHVDPIEKKPLFHFLPGTAIFSIATSGCGFRCLNCQNWDISQRKPEETKDPRGEPLRLSPEHLASLTRAEVDRLSLFPEDVVALTKHLGCLSIAYTYSEPTSYYEYMIDTARLARGEGLKNVWVTCGYIQEKPLVELCQYLDAANVDLKSFSDETYRQLNSGELRPILRTLEILKEQGVWFEVTNLLVPTYTDQPDMIRRMCDWMIEKIGPDYPLHFSRFHPAHKLNHLPPTPVDVMLEARSIARSAGLNHVYLGNVRGAEEAETTRCPKCREVVVQRDAYFVETVNLDGSQCASCGAAMAGVWE